MKGSASLKISQALALAKGRVGERLAREMMSYALNSTKEWVFLHGDDEFQGDKFERILQRFESGEPFEYICGKCEFFGSEFKVDKNVLIPRTETEILVQKTLEIARKFDAPKICEIGAGSGCIAISLGLNLNDAQITSVDISEPALNLARQNALNLGAKVEFKKSNLLDEVSGDFDIIVSNPPYIARDYELDIWVKSEPKIALFGGVRGDEILKKIVNQAARRCEYLLCEIGYDQRASLERELEICGFESEFYTDLAGFDRGFVAKKGQK